MIGRKFSDPEVKNELGRYPFLVKEGKGDGVVVGEKGYGAEEVSSMILGRMKEVAEEFLGERVTKAVVTCPA